MSLRRVALVVLLGASLTQVDCARRQRVAPPPRAPVPPLPAAERLELGLRRVQSRNRVDAVANVKGVPGLGAMGLTVDLLAERPARLYVAARSFFGPPTDELWTDGTRYVWRSARPGAGGAGPASPEVMTALLPVPLPASQWVGLLLGMPLPAEPPVAVRDCPGPDETRPRDSYCVMVMYADGARAELRLAGDGAVEEALLTREGGTLKVTYTDRRADLDGLATTLAMDLVEGNALGLPRQASLQLKEVRLNGPAPAPALFAPLDAVAPPFLDEATPQP
ncbi:MAG: hypothetical protein AB2A00_01035 [Myxococcota bacterium]